jgi:recombination associated protein RdgC
VVDAASPGRAEELIDTLRDTLGSFAVQLGLCWNDRVAFMLTEKLALKRVQLLALEADAAAPSQADATDLQEKFDTDFALMSGELTALLDEVLQLLGGEAQIAAAA